MSRTLAMALLLLAGCDVAAKREEYRRQNEYMTECALMHYDHSSCWNFMNDNVPLERLRPLGEQP